MMKRHYGKWSGECWGTWVMKQNLQRMVLKRSEMVKEAQEAETPYDAVILDLTIPGGMGGKEAINKLLEIDSEVKAIVSSGYSDDPVLSNFQEYGFKGMMPKPFEAQYLSKVLHEVLRGKGNDW